MTTEIVEAQAEQSAPMTVQEIKAQVNRIQEVMNAVMKKDEHYGTIPGCGNKPTLLKAGAEKISMTFKLVPVPIVQDLSTDTERRYRILVEIYTLNKTLLGGGVGEASSDEKKYKWRAAICDKEYEETDPMFRQIKYEKDYKSGNIKQIQQIKTNPADIANTVLKMAKKRALVDAVLTCTAASDIFTQDLEDLPDDIKKTASNTAPAKSQKKEITGVVEKYLSPNGSGPHKIIIDKEYYKTFLAEMGEKISALEGQEITVIYETVSEKGFVNNMILGIKNMPEADDQDRND